MWRDWAPRSQEKEEGEQLLREMLTPLDSAREIMCHREPSLEEVAEVKEVEEVKNEIKE